MVGSKKLGLARTGAALDAVISWFRALVGGHWQLLTKSSLWSLARHTAQETLAVNWTWFAW